ncbi:MAG: His-Xaa-Ser system protein HxsD [Candidatus Omnitrophica bacterium]|nr:His-Xaa-Ser system protein HxsD [Candidatus Omnitrophota bacterium]
MLRKKHTRSYRITVDPRVYPLRAVYSSAYLFLDRAYLSLDGDPRKKIIVGIKAKDNACARTIAAEFKNELLNASLRNQISKENRRIREYIVGTALLGVVGERMPVPDECGCRQAGAAVNSHMALNRTPGRARRSSPASAVPDPEIGDPLGIGVPWEEKYGKDDPDKL